MMGHREELRSGDEFDAITRGGRSVHRFRAGQRRWVKRKLSRRTRHAAKLQSLIESRYDETHYIGPISLHHFYASPSPRDSYH